MHPSFCTQTSSYLNANFTVLSLSGCTDYILSTPITYKDAIKKKEEEPVVPPPARGRPGRKKKEVVAQNDAKAIALIAG